MMAAFQADLLVCTYFLFLLQRYTILQGYHQLTELRVALYSIPYGASRAYYEDLSRL